MYEKHRRQRSVRLNRDERRRLRKSFLTEERGKRLNRRRPENGRYIQTLSGNVFDTRQQRHEQQRMASELEKVVAHVRFNVQQIFPDACQLRLQQIAWANAFANTFKLRSLPCSKGSSIHFPAGGQRQFIEDYKKRRR